MSHSPSTPSADASAPRWLWVLAAIGVVVLLLAVAVFRSADTGKSAVLPQQSPESGAEPDSEDGAFNEPTARFESARKLVSEFLSAVQADDVEAAKGFVADSEPSLAWAEGVVSAVQDAGIGGLSGRLIALDADSENPAQFTARISLSWRLEGVDTRASKVEVPLQIRSESGALSVEAPRRDASAKVPLWWTDRVEVSGEGALTVLDARPRGKPLTELGAVALREVGDFLPWSGPLVIEVPRNERAFASLSGLGSEQATGIAAVTTSSDGQSELGGATRVVINPKVFDPLGPLGRQIVVTHEATHVAAGAASTTMPLWLAEGFADYAALRSSDVATTALASQVLELTRLEGLPTRLPLDDDFSGSRDDVGANYEGAWLLVDTLASAVGEAELRDLYESVDSGLALERALRRSGAPDQQKLLAVWSKRLARLAGCNNSCGAARG